MKSKFYILFEQVMALIKESITGDIDALSIPEESKEWLKSLKDHNGKPDQKKQKAALHWLRNGVLALPEDMQLLKDALLLTGSLLNDFTLVKDRDEIEYVISHNRGEVEKMRDKNEAKSFNPDEEPTFSRPYSAGNGVVVYDIEDSKAAQLAVRKAIDAHWGYDANPWCLAKRVEHLPKENQLDEAWTMWEVYSEYPKRIAFKDGRLLAFSAGNIRQLVQWWDSHDDSMNHIPTYYDGAEDDEEFLKKFGKINLVQDGKFEEEFMDDPDDRVRQALASRTSNIEILKKLTKDKSWRVRCNIIGNKHVTEEILRDLAKDEDELVKDAVVKSLRSDAWALTTVILDERIDLVKRARILGDALRTLRLHEPAIRKIIENSDFFIKKRIAAIEETPPEILDKLSNDEDWRVRENVALNPNAPDAALKRLLQNDENQRVKQAAKDSIAYNKREI